MQLVDMKCSPQEQQSEMAMPSNASPYPYGLRIYLDDASLDKLGIENLPELGAELTIQAKVKVVGRNERADDSDPDGDNDYKCLDLQITQMAIPNLPKDPVKVAEKMYPEKK